MKSLPSRKYKKWKRAHSFLNTKTGSPSSTFFPLSTSVATYSRLVCQHVLHTVFLLRLCVFGICSVSKHSHVSSILSSYASAQGLRAIFTTIPEFQITRFNAPEMYSIRWICMLLHISQKKFSLNISPLFFATFFQGKAVRHSITCELIFACVIFICLKCSFSDWSLFRMRAIKYEWLAQKPNVAPSCYRYLLI